MPDSGFRRRARRWAPLGLLAMLAAATPAAAGDCSALARQLKLDALDQLWGAVLDDAGKLLECDPHGPQAKQARFYRARALDRLRRGDEALHAYDEFLRQDCGTLESDFLCDDAVVSRIDLVADKASRGDKDFLKVLVDTLGGGDSSSRIYAAIQASKLPGAGEVKAKALPILVEGYRLEEDPDFRNEICLAIIRIDPAKCGEGTSTRNMEREEPKFIKVRVFDCKADKVKVSANMPFSFARAIMESLGPQILDEIKKEGFDLENLWESLKKMGPEQVFQFKIDEEDHCEEVEVWFE